MPVQAQGTAVLDPWQLSDQYNDESRAIAEYLSTLRRPELLNGLARSEWKRWKQDAHRFTVQDGQLFRKAGRKAPLRRYVDNDELRSEVMLQLHEGTGHFGIEAATRLVADRYWWPNLYMDVKRHVKSCFECQMRIGARTQEELHATWVTLPWYKIGLDITYMPAKRGKQYLVLARDDLSG
jgi:hypothetical protein